MPVPASQLIPSPQPISLLISTCLCLCFCFAYKIMIFTKKAFLNKSMVVCIIPYVIPFIQWIFE